MDYVDRFRILERQFGENFVNEENSKKGKVNVVSVSDLREAILDFNDWNYFRSFGENSYSDVLRFTSRIDCSGKTYARTVHLIADLNGDYCAKVEIPKGW